MLQSIVRRRVALGALLLGTFMGVLDVFVVTVALPAAAPSSAPRWPAGPPRRHRC